MLLLSKLDKTKVLIPLEAVKYIEETPDTLIRFLNGESVLVRESLSEIQAKVAEMRNTHHKRPTTEAREKKTENEHLNQ